MKLVLSGKKAYIKRMYKHLKKEHPSTRTRLKIISKRKNKHRLLPWHDKRTSWYKELKR